MIKCQLESTLSKPSVRLKLLIITFLFIPALIEQSEIMGTLTGEIRNGGKTTVAIMLLYTFNYLYFYVDILTDISLTMESGNIYGFVGDNGAGKTVLFKIFLGLMKKTSGSITINGTELNDLLQDVVL